MRAQPATPHPDQVISRLADRQHGVVSRRQVLALGVSLDAIRHRVRTGHLIPIHRGIYAVGHRRLRIEGVWLAAVLACGPGAVLSHRDAAALWDLRPTSRAATDITVPTVNGRAKRPGITIHRSRTLSLIDAVGTRDRIPVTDPSRTLLDLADVVSPQALERAFRQAEIKRLYDRRTLEAHLQANPGRHGARAFAQALARRTTGPTTRSTLEAAFLRLCKTNAIPPPDTNVWLDPYEVDFLWPEHRVIAELDSTTDHHTLTAFHVDRAKDAHLTAAGYRVLRFTDRHISEEPRIVVATLVRTLTPPRPRRRGPRPRRTAPLPPPLP
jgi:very-short-patch-repair endonuclease